MSHQNFFSRDNSDMSRDHRFVNGFVWDLPRLQKGSKADAILGNWRLSGILTLQAGRPFSVGATNNPMAGAGSARADLVGAGYPVLDPGRSKGERLAAYFDKARFTNPPPGTYGTLGRNILIAPASLLNATHMANPVVGQTNPNFGKITGTDGAPRILADGPQSGLLKAEGAPAAAQQLTLENPGSWYLFWQDISTRRG